MDPGVVFTHPHGPGNGTPVLDLGGSGCTRPPWVLALACQGSGGTERGIATLAFDGRAFLPRGGIRIYEEQRGMGWRTNQLFVTKKDHEIKSRSCNVFKNQ